MDPGRRAHYADFYGGPFHGPAPAGSVALVHGNCQAESLRVLLSGSPAAEHRYVRMPPVHELTRDDLPHLHALLDRTTLLLSQPVRDGYRALPLGTAELVARLPRGARVLRWPVIRFTGLHPFSAIVRHPDDMALVPPVVPYHDLRTLAAAAGLIAGPPPGPDALRASAAASVRELARRERDTDVGVADVLLRLGADAAHTINHPGNAVLMSLARRVQRAIGQRVDVADPGRDLLGGIRAPLDEPVIDALGLDVAPRPHWLVDGAEIADDDVRTAQLDWYGTRPQWVAAGVERHAARLDLLGLR